MLLNISGKNTLFSGCFKGESLIFLIVMFCWMSYSVWKGFLELFVRLLHKWMSSACMVALIGRTKSWSFFPCSKSCFFWGEGSFLLLLLLLFIIIIIYFHCLYHLWLRFWFLFRWMGEFFGTDWPWWSY